MRGLKIKNKQMIWISIDGYDNDYHVNTYGDIKSFKRYDDGIILKSRQNKDGYLYVRLYKNGKSKYCLIHRLVAGAFIQNTDPEKFNQINHKDENKENNYFENLEWCDPQYNVEYSQSKIFTIEFPDIHREDHFNLNKFCDDNNLNQGAMSNTFIHGQYHKGFKVLKIKDKNGDVKKAKSSYRKIYLIETLNGDMKKVNNLNSFCNKNNLNPNSMHVTLRINSQHRGFKILGKLDRSGNIFSHSPNKIYQMNDFIY